MPFRLSTSAASVLVVALCITGQFTRAQDAPKLDFEQYELPNGLDVILYQDRSMPIVSVNVWYHVGSGNEEPGRTGFAHLFEHMMFEGSEHHPDDFDAELDALGAFVNGSTSTDRTNYVTDIPSNYLELALWLESDRMGYLLAALTEEKFETQRSVVKNERRQNYENPPYGEWYPLLVEMLYPADHPYSWPTIGSMEDLDAATIEDISAFFNAYYTPSNASLVLGGDFDIDEAKRLVETYFAGIPPGPPVTKLTEWVPELSQPIERTVEDDIELPRVYRAWHSPGFYKEGDAEFDLLASILSSGKTSRLYESLVYNQGIAQDVSAFQWSREMGGIFVVQATASPGHSLQEVEQALDVELARLLTEGVTQDEVDGAITETLAGNVRALQEVGGLSGVADRLNQYNYYLGTPDGIEQDFERYRSATTEGVLSFARNYLDPSKRATLRFVPAGDLAATETGVNRSVAPAPTAEPSFTPPTIQRAVLDNGLGVLVVEDHDLPLVEVRLVVKSGFAADPVELPGVASLTAELLDEGTESMTALELDRERKRLGLSMSTGSLFDGSNLRMNVLRDKLDEGMSLFAEVALRPTFPESELERQRAIYQGNIAQEAHNAQITAIKAFLEDLYGTGHPYAQPYTGTGTSESITQISRNDLVSFYQTNYRPNNAALVFAGDISLPQAREVSERFFGSWESGDIATTDVPEPPARSSLEVHIVDKPGAEQSVIMVGQVGMKRSASDYRAFQVVNNALGGTFRSRINQNLREDKGYTYGAGSFSLTTRGTGAFIIIAPVQSDKTKESVVELLKEYREIISTRPITPQEVDDAKGNLIKGFPQNFQSLQSIAAQAGSLVIFDLPDDEWSRFTQDVGRITPTTADQTAQNRLDPESALIVIVGDREIIEPGLQELGLEVL